MFYSNFHQVNHGWKKQYLKFFRYCIYISHLIITVLIVVHLELHLLIRLDEGFCVLLRSRDGGRHIVDHYCMAQVVRVQYFVNTNL